MQPHNEASTCVRKNSCVPCVVFYTQMERS